MSAGCQSDDECGVNQLCYEGVSWLDGFDYENNTSGCFCNTFYAFDDFPTCTQLTFSSYVTIVWNTVNVLISLRGCYVAILVLHRLKQEGTLLRLGAASVTVLLGGVASFGSGVWSIVFILSTLFPGRPLVELDNAYGGQFNWVLWAVTPLTVAFTALAILNIALTWLDVAKSTEKFSSVRLRTMRRLIRLFQAAIVAMGIVGGYLEKKLGYSVFGFFYTPLVLYVLFAYLVGAQRLTSIIKNATSVSMSSSWKSDASESNASKQEELKWWCFGHAHKERKTGTLQRVLEKIRLTTVKVTFIVVVYWVATLGISITDVLYADMPLPGWKYITPPGSFSIVKSLHHLQITATALCALVISSYFRKSKDYNVRKRGALHEGFGDPQPPAFSRKPKPAEEPTEVRWLGIFRSGRKLSQEQPRERSSLNPTDVDPTVVEDSEQVVTEDEPHSVANCIEAAKPSAPKGRSDA